MKKIFVFVIALAVTVSASSAYAYIGTGIYEYYYGDVEEYQGKTYNEILGEQIRSMLNIYDKEINDYIYIGKKFTPELANIYTEEITINGNDYTSVGSGGMFFESLQNLKSITATNGLLSISDMTFSHCNIEEISLPETLLYMGIDSFGDCTKLKSVKLPQSLEMLDLNTFQRCYALESVDLGGVRHIGENAFEHCTSLKEIDLSSVEYISTNAFADCNNLTGTIHLNNIKYIERGAFSGTSIKDIYLPETIEGFESLYQIIHCKKGGKVEQMIKEMDGTAYCALHSDDGTVEYVTYFLGEITDLIYDGEEWHHPTPEPDPTPTPTPDSGIEHDFIKMDIGGGEESRSLRLTNYGETPADSLITFVAKYNSDGEMIGCKTMNYTEYDLHRGNPYDILIYHPDIPDESGILHDKLKDGEYIKVMIWNTDLKPIHDAWTVTEDTVWKPL